MALEIERKFLVKDQTYRDSFIERHHLTQGYLSLDPEHTVRIRISDDTAWITVKSRNHGAVRNEWEYPIPVSDAREMLSLCGDAVLSKWRYVVEYGEHRWEIDEYEGRLAPLLVAEVEMDSEDCSPAIPPFIGKEVTGDARYYNSALVASLY